MITAMKLRLAFYRIVLDFIYDTYDSGVIAWGGEESRSRCRAILNLRKMIDSAEKGAE